LIHVDQNENYLRNLKSNLVDDLGSVMISIVPEIEIFIGPQKEITPLSRIEEVQKRLFESFITFFNCFSEKKNLILVIDDLQWGDAASFNLLEKLLSLEDSNIFIIGAFRDNEVDLTHPLSYILEKFSSTKTIKLQPLKLDHLNEMICETLHRPKKEILELGELIHKKTLGSPFFSREFLNTLYEEDLIFQEKESWCWDIEKVKKKNFSSNVIDFMIQNLKKESLEMQKVLSLASCLGNTFSNHELAFIFKENNLNDFLVEPVQSGWILQLSSHEYQFFHDRLHQAAYEIFPEEDKIKTHKILGVEFLKLFKEKKCGKEQIFKIVNHLNISNSIFEDKNQLLQLNVMAAEQCSLNSAVKSAHEYSTIAMSFLTENHWENNYENAYIAYSTHASACYGVGDVKNSEIYFQNIMDNLTDNRIQRFNTCSNFMKMAAITYQFEKGLEILMKSFEMFDLTKEAPNYINDEEWLMNWIKTLKLKIDKQLIEFGGVKDLDEKLPKCKDEEIVIFQKMLTECTDIVKFTSNRLFCVAVALVSLHLCLIYGFTENIPCTISIGAWYLSSFFKDPKGYDWTLLAEKLSQKSKGFFPYNNSFVECCISTNYQFGGTVKGMMFHMEEAIKWGISNSEFIYGSYAICHYTSIVSINGIHIPSTLKKVKKHHDVSLIYFHFSGF
jgi:hypothetical protein